MNKSKLPEYRHWINMISRCENPNAPWFEIYGGRGVKICKPWRESFSNFYQDMGPRPSPKHSVDRIDSDGNYEPSNCRWATPSAQGRNKRTNHIVIVNGVKMTLADAADLAPVGYNTFLYRLKRGWSLDDAISLPRQKGIRP